MSAKDAIVLIEELENKGLLEKVEVQSPPDDVKETGNQKSAAISETLNLILNCADKSICFVKAMREKGENDWYFVPGFAFNSECKNPFRHVWIGNGVRYYDPTWYTRWNPEDLIYYQLLQPFEGGIWESEKDIINQGNDILHELNKFAEKWGLTLAGRLD